MNYANLLHLRDKYKIMEMNIKTDDWLANKSLKKLKIRDEGVMVLGITRKDGNYIGAPDGTTKIKSAGTLILYGRDSALEKLYQRKLGSIGDEEHKRAVDEQKDVVRKEKELDTMKR